MLSRLASVFKESIRSSDYAARYGGEEFIVMLPEIGLEQGVEAAERIRHKVAEERFGDDGESIKVTISVGVASYPESGQDAESVIRNADEALYEAKELGRNQVVLAGAQKKKKKRKKSKAK